MKKIYALVVSIIFSCCLFAQQKSLLDYDECKDDISKHLQKKYEKAVDYFNKKKYQQSSLLLQDIIKENESFASPYFLLGMIGVVKDNTAMIMKYFPLVKENCEEFSHPYLYYYLGMINYTEEKYLQASKDFEQFLKLTDQNNKYDSLQEIAINYIDWSEFLQQTMGNKVPFEPKKINFLAKNKNYYEPFVAWDKNEIWFIREEVQRDTNFDSFTGEISTSYHRYLERSVFDSTGFYDKGFILDAPFNNHSRFSGVSITADNNYIYFSVKNDLKDNQTWDIYCVERIDDYFSSAKSLNINTTSADEFSPCVSADGNTLYFVSNRSGGKGGLDIWVSKKVGKDTWSEPENLGRGVNTFGNESYPFIAADNTHLYFLSNGRKTLGGNDIFVYNIKKQYPADNIGYPINTEANEHSIVVAADGKTAYSTLKNADNKFMEINQFTLTDKCRADERVLVNGNMQKTLNGDIVLKLFDIHSSEITSYYIADEHSNFTLVIEKNKDYICVLNQKGYMFYVVKVNDKTENVLIKQLALETGSSVELNCIEFDESKVNFKDISQQILDDFVMFLKTYSRIRITITSNEKMSNALKTYLLKSGIREDRLSFDISSDNKVIYTIK